jgi:hypothetical protein
MAKFIDKVVIQTSVANMQIANLRDIQIVNQPSKQSRI